MCNFNKAVERLTVLKNELIFHNHNSVILRTQLVLQIPITNTILKTMTLNTAQMTTLNYSKD